MASATEYRKYAEECMDTADRASTPSRERLIQMAETWLRLAQEQLSLEQMARQTAPSTDKVQ